MIPYEIYHIVHIFSLILFFCSITLTLMGINQKNIKIMTGVTTFFILVSGMGLIARIGISHGAGWPLWLYGKLGVWVILGIATPIVAKRKPQYSKHFLAFIAVLVLAQLYFVNYKPA